jgi:non-ribosomal peptide synthetase component F
MMLLHEAALSQASKLPERTALVWGGTRLTYGALATSSARIASMMRADGVGAGDRVALYLRHPVWGRSTCRSTRWRPPPMRSRSSKALSRG